MKISIILALFLVAGVSVKASLVTFQLSPPGTDTAVGLSPSNQIPVAVGSTGSGGLISGGIVYDTDSGMLQVAVGYGSAAGFTDLTGPAVGMHIHGPAGPGTNASVLVSLVPFNFPAANPTNGGVIIGTVSWPTNQLSALLSGDTYLNIHTPQFPGGEIRGQLIPVNQAPLVVCPPAASINCGTPTSLVALFTDAEGDELTVVWAVNGVATATNTLPARGAGLPAMDTFTNQLAFGTNTITVMVSDSAGNTVSCDTQIIVVDTSAPQIMNASATPSTLWPPNHQWVTINLQAQVFDSCGATTWRILRVTSNEPVTGHGSGNTSPDWIITGDHTLKLRAERSGNGNGRIYSIVLQATDEAGNVSATKTVRVTVPHNR